jgi:hypothetical protein
MMDRQMRMSNDLYDWNLMRRNRNQAAGTARDTWARQLAGSPLLRRWAGAAASNASAQELMQ